MVITCGLTPLSSKKRIDQRVAVSSSNPYRIEYSYLARGDMPVFKWSRDFEDLLDRRFELRKKYQKKGLSLNPWDIDIPEGQLGSSVIWWNQGSIPSCSAHGCAHAFQAAELITIGLKQRIRYESVNPIYSFYRGRGGDIYGGGLDVMTISEEINKTGFYVVSDVGKDNQSVSKDKVSYTESANNHQAGIVRIEKDYTENIFRVCRGLGTVAFGSGIFFGGSKTDSNGVRVMDNVMYGGHMQAFFGWKSEGGKEYVYNLNSHGDKYGTDGREPKSGAWVSKDQVDDYAVYFNSYGMPLVIFAEGELTK